MRTVIGICLEEEIDHKLAALSKQRRLTKSNLFWDAIQRYLGADELASIARL